MAKTHVEPATLAATPFPSNNSSPVPGLIPQAVVRIRGSWLGLGVLMLVTLLLASPVRAFTLSDGTEASCQVSRDGRTGNATERWSNYQNVNDRDPELGKAVAVVRRDEQGWPVIILDAVAYKQSKAVMAAMWDFIFFHECAHAREPAMTEIDANCDAYIAMQARGLMNPIRSKDIEAAHLRIMNLPDEYGGNGIGFWRLTMECVDRRTASAALTTGTSKP